MNFACSLCGNRDWPDPDSHCPLCRADEPDTPEDEPGEHEPDEPEPIDELKHRNAIRRETSGVRHTAEPLHCDEINKACDRFFKSRGMPSYTFKGERKDEPVNPPNKLTAI